MKLFKGLFRSMSLSDKNQVKVDEITYNSKTNYLIIVKLSEFTVKIYTGGNNKWKLIKNYKCSIGKPSTPTPKGEFEVGVKGLYFGVKKGYKCWYYTQFKGNYLFHSIIYNLDGSIRDARLGKALSDGCIRLLKVNAKWIWDNVPKGSKVVIK